MRPARRLLAAAILVCAVPAEARTVMALSRPSPGDDLLRIASREDLKDARRKLTEVVFGRRKVPRRLYPRRVGEAGVGRLARLYRGPLPARSVETLALEMDHGIRSNIQLYRGKDRSRSVVIWHRGHEGNFLIESDPVGPLLAEGHDVILLDMPLIGMNSRPVEIGEGREKTLMVKHRDMKALERPLRYFMKPIAAAVNHALRKERYSRVALAGFSGGAWSVTLYAAMDPRIRTTVAIAGTMPEAFLWFARARREKPPGDLEQRYAPILEVATYPEMWLMGSSGRGRRQLQVQVLSDLTYKFTAEKEGVMRAVSRIQDEVRRRLRSIGSGEFSLHVDQTITGHRISSRVLEMLLEEVTPPE